MVPYKLGVKPWLPYSVKKFIVAVFYATLVHNYLFFPNPVYLYVAIKIDVFANWHHCYYFFKGSYNLKLCNRLATEY